MHVQDVIIRAILSEKSMKESESGRYTFLVKKDANKGDVKRAVESMFQVDVVSVITRTQKGRTARTGARRTEVTTSAFKKAAVRLKAGQTLGAAADEVKEKKVTTDEKSGETEKKGVVSLLAGRLGGKGKK